MTREPQPTPQWIPEIGDITNVIGAERYVGKFIIVKQDNSLVFHAGPNDNWDMFHKTIAENLGITGEVEEQKKHVLAGGDLVITNGVARLDAASGHFDGAPKEVLELFVDQLKTALGVSDVILTPRANAEDYRRFGLTPSES